MNIIEKLESLGKNSIQLEECFSEGRWDLGASRFGGNPDVPPDFVWPTYEGEDHKNVVKERPLSFLAQFACADLAPFDKEHLLPDHGLLSFFYESNSQPWGDDPKDKGCARVYWFEDSFGAVHCRLPSGYGGCFQSSYGHRDGINMLLSFLGGLQQSVPG